jgi:hypothetical protein
MRGQQGEVTPLQRATIAHGLAGGEERVAAVASAGGPLFSRLVPAVASMVSVSGPGPKPQYLYAGAFLRCGLAGGCVVAREVDDFPEVAVGIAEVAGVDSPGSLMRRRRYRCACVGGELEDAIDFRAAIDEVPDADPRGRGVAPCPG